MRCGRCGTENGETNRFCGMCGAPLPAKPAAAAVPRSVAAPVGRSETAGMAPMANARPSLRPSSSSEPHVLTPPSIAPARTASPTRDEPMNDPIISGPSFLGLNKAAEPRASDRLSDPTEGEQHPLASFDSRDRYSSNLDYLLQDEEEPKRGWGKLLAVVIALALLGGFGYLRWKEGGFDWLIKGQKTTQAVDSTSSTTDGVKNDAAPAAGANQPVGTSAPSSATAAPNPTTKGVAAPNSTTPTGTEPGTTPAPTSAPTGAGTNSGTDSGIPPDTAAPSAAPENAVPGNPTGATGTGAEGNPPAATAGNTAPEADNAETTAPPAKPAPTTKKIREPKPTPVTPTDPTAEAESYIYGRGVSQDCDRGLRLLKPAAAHSVKAMIALGTLYSSGTCAPRDLPTAYRYFAMALHQQPDNQPVQNDLQDIWAKMTQPERQLAIKLSQ